MLDDVHYFMLTQKEIFNEVKGGVYYDEYIGPVLELLRYLGSTLCALIGSHKKEHGLSGAKKTKRVSDSP